MECPVSQNETRGTQLGKVSEAKEPTFGYNAQSGEYEDLVKAGVLESDEGGADGADQCRGRSRR
ncbi:MAG TPA: hypothetical protein VK466_14270 [Terriglobales bacterium]|nr:hypothetical protein [Terriglobales bacterium]